MQMNLIRTLLKTLTTEQVRTFAKTDYNYLQMLEFVKGFEQGLTFEQVKEYANPKYNYMNMSLRRKMILLGKKAEQ